MTPPVTGIQSSPEVQENLQYDLVCLSHLRWDFVYQRPQHLMSRCAQERRVFFVEEPLFDSEQAYLETSFRSQGLCVVTPHLPSGIGEEGLNMRQASMIDALLNEHAIKNYVLWYYTPMALAFTGHLEPLAIVYDCMDELSAFNNSPQALRQYEAELLIYADLIFTGGQSLYEAKRTLHRHVYAFPSSVDANHFLQARSLRQDPLDQATIPHPRLGFYGVLDERMNLSLVSHMADAQPDWHLILIGPVAKIDAQLLPVRENIHYLGTKPYAELPHYLAGWDIAIMPFAHNQATRFISPTKTLEYLAGGKRVVSTSIRDVVSPYGKRGLVAIADEPDDFVDAAQKMMEEDDPMYLQMVDAFLSQTSWDTTWTHMRQLLDEQVADHIDWPAYSLASSSVSQRTVFNEVF